MEEKKCLNCKFYYAGYCNNKNVKNNITTIGKSGAEYSEEGVLSEALRENLDFNLLADEIIYILKEKDLLKKKFYNTKIDFNDTNEEEEIIRLIDDALYVSLSNYFGITGEDIKITKPYEFSCNNWE